MHVMIEFLNTGAQAGKLRVAQPALLVQVHCHRCQFVEQLLPLLHQLIDLALFAARAQLFLGLPARATDSRAHNTFRILYKICHSLPAFPVIVLYDYMLFFTHRVGIDPYFPEFPVEVEINGYHVNTPRAVARIVRLEIKRSDFG